MDSEKLSNTVELETRGDLLILHPFKEIDINVSKSLLCDARKKIEEGYIRIIMDLSRLEFIDSTGLSVMVDLQDAATRLGGKVVFAEPGARVMRILKVTRLDRYIEQYPDMETAEASFAEKPRAEAGVV